MKYKTEREKKYNQRRQQQNGSANYSNNIKTVNPDEDKVWLRDRAELYSIRSYTIHLYGSTELKNVQKLPFIVFRIFDVAVVWH